MNLILPILIVPSLACSGNPSPLLLFRTPSGWTTSAHFVGAERQAEGGQ
ncbi:MAG: hypothetical protein ABIK23_01600 [candidate division WOR-3 bacterium]